MTGPWDAEIRETLLRLRSTPQHLTRLAAGLTHAQLDRPPSPGAWSLAELLAHVRGAAEVQGVWIARMLAEHEPTIRYASPRTGMRKVTATRDTFPESLRAFVRGRTDLVRLLAPLTPAAWARHASFTGTTPGWTPTVFDVAHGMATHEQSHVEQIESAAAAVRG